MGFLSAMLWPDCIPFTVALGVMLAIAVMEGAGAIIGWSASAALGNLIDVDVPDADITGDTPGGALSRTLGWLRIGRVPVLIGLIVTLTTFGIAGIAVQGVAATVFGEPLNAWIAAPAVALFILPAVRSINGWLGAIMPRDESEAVSRSSFMGRTGVVTLGPVTHTQAGQCRIRDEHGQSHYVMIEADVDGDSFAKGTSVLLVRETGSRWRVIAGEHRTGR